MDNFQIPPQRADEILESITDAFAAFDAQWRFIYVNRSYLQLVSPLYTSAEELIGHSLWEKFPDIKDRPAGEFYRRAMQTQAPAEIELFYSPLQLWLEIRAQPSPSILALYVRDVTERKAQECTLLELSHTIAEQSGIFDAILSNIPDQAFAFDGDQRVIYANEALLALWGLKMEDARGRNLHDLNYPPELAAKLIGEMRDVMNRMVAVRGEVVFQEDFHEYVFSPAISKGNVTAVVGTSRIVTERKLQERSAEKRRRTMQLIVQDAPLPEIFDEIIVALETAFSGTVGFLHRQDCENRNLHLVAAPSLSEDFAGLISTVSVGPRSGSFGLAASTGKAVCVTDALQDDQWADVRAIAQALGIRACWSVPIRSIRNEIVGTITLAFTKCVVASEDNVRSLETFAHAASLAIEQKRTQGELVRARDEALAASRAKDEFLAALSHELRSPLNPVLLLATEYLSKPELSPDVRTTFASIVEHVSLEARLIDDLLDLTSIAHGKILLDRHPVDLKVIAESAILVVEDDFNSKGVSLTKEFPNTRMYIDGDGTRLQQVVWNVLRNAVKFTPPGGEVVIRARPSDEGTEHILEILDTGMGMTQNEIDSAFNAFAQGEHVSGGSGSHRFGGLGLGLAISHRIIHAHGGNIRASSEGRNRGSTFTIALPMVPVPEDERSSTDTAPSAFAARSDPGAPPPSGVRARLLLVEDHAATRTVLATLLTARNYEVRQAESVAEAREIAESEPIDFVVSDLGLPDGDGYELMRILHERHGLEGIALSGYGMKEDVRRSEAAGFLMHIVKPVDVRTLERALAEALRSPPETDR